MKYYFTFFSIILLLASCDGFEIEKQIVGNYYITKYEGIINLSYKLENGAYVGKIPATIIEYGFNQKYIVGKTIDNDSQIAYYIIDRKKDFDSAIEDNFRIGPITESQYELNWKKKLKVKLLRAEK